MSVQSEPVSTGVAPQPPTHPGNRRLPPQVTAWVVLLLAFGLFCLLVYSAVNIVTEYLSQSLIYKDAVVRLVKDHDANVYVRRNGDSRETLVNLEETVREGDEIRTDKNSEAVLVLFDESRVTLASTSRVRLQESRVVVKNFRQTEKRLLVEVMEGQAWFNLASFVPGKDFNRSTFKALIPAGPGGTPVGILFNDPQSGNYANGTYNLTVNRSNESGLKAWVSNKARQAVDVQGTNGRVVSLKPGQRVALDQGVPGEPGLPAELQVNLIENGSYINGIDSWRPQFIQGPDQGSIEGLIKFDAERIDDGSQTRSHIQRLDPRAAGNYAETSLIQEINRDITEYDELWFSLKLKLVEQSLAGGGQFGSEYPVFIKIQYVDQSNNNQEFFHGFYFRAPDARTQVLDLLGRSTPVLQNDWYEFRQDLMRMPNKPSRILKIVVGSAGHLYNSYFTDVSLIAR